MYTDKIKRSRLPQIICVCNRKIAFRGLFLTDIKFYIVKVAFLFRIATLGTIIFLDNGLLVCTLSQFRPEIGLCRTMAYIGDVFQKWLMVKRSRPALKIGAVSNNKPGLGWPSRACIRRAV